MYVLLSSLCLLVCCSDFGGMRGDYPARDYDPRLTEIAEKAVPLIHAIQQYERQESRYPRSLDEIASLLPEDRIERWQSGGAVKFDGWIYSPRNGHFELFYQLGWDPTLIFDSRDGSWTFQPGDGSPPKSVALSVGLIPEPAEPQNAEKRPARIDE